jgi:putative PIN family toxin of toxin-antitoxin system
VVDRKRRTRVVFDTNVIVSFYLSRNPRASQATVFRLWRDRRLLELVVSHEIVSEYVEVLERLTVHPLVIQRLVERLEARTTVTWVNPGPRVTASRDPDDNVFLSAAKAGNVEYLITNDHDLLDLPVEERKKLRFQILRPFALLDQFAIP